MLHIFFQYLLEHQKPVYLNFTRKIKKKPNKIMIRELFIFYEWLHFITSVRDNRYIYMICFHLINKHFFFKRPIYYSPSTQYVYFRYCKRYAMSREKIIAKDSLDFTRSHFFSLHNLFLSLRSN